MSDCGDNVAKRVAVAKHAAHAGSAVSEKDFETDIEVDIKQGRTDFVTHSDLETQQRIIEVIHTAYPNEPIVAEEEEARKTVPDTGPSWVIDPIDGTNNYVRHIPLWATQVTVMLDGKAVGAVIVSPSLGDTTVATQNGVWRNGDRVTVSDRSDPKIMTVVPTIWWEYDRRDEYAAACQEIVHRFGDLRRFGCIGVVMPMIACGSLDGAMTNVLTNPWDSVAGAYMVERAGGTVTDLAGDPWRHDSRGLVASNGEAHGELLAAARAVDAVR